MADNLRLPWTVKQAPNALDDYCMVVDAEGRDIFTVYAMHSNAKTPQIRYILEMCNPKPEEVKEPVEISASPSF